MKTTSTCGTDERDPGRDVDGHALKIDCYITCIVSRNGLDVPDDLKSITRESYAYKTFIDMVPSK